MKEDISVLLIQDSNADQDIILNELRKGGFNLKHQCVSSELGLIDSLNNRRWDLILSDVNQLDFNNQKVLDIVSKSESDAPTILIAGDIPEKVAASAMEAGARDYLRKDNLQRLVPAVKRELHDAEVRKKKKQAEVEKDFLSEVVEKSLNEIFVIDSRTLRFSYANETALTNLGYTLEEIQKLGPIELLPDYDSNSFMQIFKPLVNRDKNKITLYTELKRKDGSTYPVETHIHAINRMGRDHYVATSFDITDKKKYEALIKQQRELAQKLALSSKYKSKFLSNFSHELRTSLNSIILLGKMLAENNNENLSKDQLEYAQLIYHSSVDLLELLNEILDLSKIESGKMDIRLDEVHVQDICNKLKRLYMPIAREQKISFNCEITASDIDIVQTDAMRIEQILKNLLSNAFKFTEKGSISLEVYRPDPTVLQKKIGSSKGIAFRVKDTGIGIPKNKQHLIFESFRQADESTEEKYGGTGLGLAICREITSILGGKLSLKSEVGLGSTFTLFIPEDSHRAVEEQERKGRATIKENGTIAKPEIPEVALKEERTSRKSEGIVLLIDDSYSHNVALKEFLNNKISKCITADTATEGYNMLEKYPVDCIVLDMYLPDADGFDVMTHLKGQDKYKDLPIIIYSGKSISPKEEKKLKKYANAIVRKNAQSYKILLDRITAILNEKAPHS